MRVVRSISVLTFALLLGACTATPTRVVEPAPTMDVLPAHDNLNATLWMQNSAEYDATVRGIYAAAKRSLDAALQDPSWNALPQGEFQAGFERKPVAIIVDADETIIDNSAYQARSIIERRGYTVETWQEWVKAEAAAAMPGAVDFAQFVDSRDVTIFYVTNRDAPEEVEATVANLRRLGFPVADDASNVMLRGDLRAPESEKGTRRSYIDRNYRVVLMLGDNLGDFLDGISADMDTRQRLMAPYEKWWGERWFMFPNPAYGSWENALLRSCDNAVSPRDCVKSLLRHNY